MVMKSLGKMALLAMAVTTFSFNSSAQAAPGDETAFGGKVSAVNKRDQTLTVGKRTFRVLPTTTIVKNGKSATGKEITVNEIKVGEEVGGQYKKSADGKLELLSLRVGSKALSEAKGGSKDVGATSEAGASFGGKVAKTDKSTQTLTIGKRTFQILPTTPITRNGTPASFDDVKAGEEVSGNYKKSAEGKMELLSLRIGGKAEKK